MDTEESAAQERERAYADAKLHPLTVVERRAAGRIPVRVARGDVVTPVGQRAAGLEGQEPARIGGVVDLFPHARVPG